MNSFQFTFFIKPIVKKATLFGKGRAYKHKRTRDFEVEIAETARKYIINRYNGSPWPLKVPLIAEVTFWLSKPKKPKFEHPAVRPDTDNYCKSLFDALNGILIQDDGLIVELHASKKYTTEEPKIDLVLSEK